MRYVVIDIETRIDKVLLQQTFYPGSELEPAQAYERFLTEFNTDFAPLPLHVPISIAVGNVSEDYGLESVESLALDDYEEERLVRQYWERAERFNGCIVSFNGRSFDLPVLELAAMRHGLQLPAHFGPEGPRVRFGDRHFDLFDFLTNHRAYHLRGGLDLLLKLIGLPGKDAVSGADVQPLYEQGRLAEIHRYCRADVIQTYFLFLRVELMRGRLSPSRYNEARDAAAPFLREVAVQP